MNSTAELPYELHTHGCGPFVIFNVGNHIALPLIALARATLRTTRGGDEIVLEFHGVEVVIEGHALAFLLEHLLTGRVKRVSCARDATSEVTRIRLTETGTG